MSSDPTPDAPPPAAGPNRSAMFVAFLVTAIDLLGFGIVLPLMPRLAGRYIADDDPYKGAIIGVLFSVFSVMQFVFTPMWGRVSDRVGRKQVLVAGWLLAVPVPFLLMWAPAWGWVLFANALLGASQGLTWSTTVIMKIDLAGPERRGFALGLNECAGYLALGASALATGYLAATHGLRPQPFYLGVGFVFGGLLLSALSVRETHGHARHEAGSAGGAATPIALRA